jgi:hypothetical protein
MVRRGLGDEEEGLGWRRRDEMVALLHAMWLMIGNKID